MTDLENDPLATAFDEFRGEIAPFVQPAGVARARETVRARKRNHTVALGTLATLVIAIPAAAYATVGGDRQARPTPAVPSSDVASIAAPASVPVSVPISSGPASSPSSAATRTPRGAIPGSALANATLDLPAWPAGWRDACPPGPLKFTDGDHMVGQSDHITIAKVLYVDVNHDGNPETVALFRCDSEYSTDQVVAFERGANGKIQTMGRVTRTTANPFGSTQPADAVTNICDVRAGSNGSIQAQVVDFPLVFGCSQPGDIGNRWVDQQWRTFGWSGSGFTQIGGPATFPANPYAADLSATSTDLIMVKAANGHYQGTITMTVKNLGPATIPYMTIIRSQPGLTLTSPSTGCSASTSEDVETTTCAGAALAAGSSRSWTLQFDSPTRTMPDFLPSAAVDVVNGYGDPDPSYNSHTFQVRY